MMRFPTPSFTRPGEYQQLEARVRTRMRGVSRPTLFVYAFDPRTRLGPFVFVDKMLIPGSAHAIASALAAVGFRRLRVVLQQWCPNIRPSRARLGSQPPELLLISSMQIHSRSAYALIEDAWRLGPHRPLILVGGPKAHYEPWDVLSLPSDPRIGADIAVLGEEYVMLRLLEALLEHTSPAETLREGFQRIRREGLLQQLPGLAFAPDDAVRTPPYLVKTAPQPLLRQLDELPPPFPALGLFERPHRRQELDARPLPLDHLRRYGRVFSLVATRGCKFRCSYCPIPEYNRFAYRFKQPERVAEEIAGVAERTGMRCFFGADDNFFNQRNVTTDLLQTMARGRVGRRPFRDAVFFGTEATLFDVFRNADLLPLAREAGVRALWFGIEDLTGQLVKKGQSSERARSIFGDMLRNGIAPMPMMMHHDAQPVWTRRGLGGLLNQVRFLHRAGALSMQVTLLMPSVGSRSYAAMFQDGQVLGTAAGVAVEDYQYDGNHCIATHHTRAWSRQLNLLLAYAGFYNPWNLVRALCTFDSLRSYRLMYQVSGMLGLLKSAFAARRWFWRLVRGPIEKQRTPPGASMPVVRAAEFRRGASLDCRRAIGSNQQVRSQV